MVSKNAIYKRNERIRKVENGLILRSMWIRNEYKKFARPIELTLREEGVLMEERSDGSTWMLIKHLKKPVENKSESESP